MKKQILSVLITFSTTFAIAQNHDFCGTDYKHQQMLEKDQAYRMKTEESIKNWEKFKRDQQDLKQRGVVSGTDSIFEIPVVVHVLSNGDPIGSTYNPSDSAIQSWIDYSNGLFAAEWPGIPDVDGGGVNMPFRLVLAKRDENCNATSGIVRVDMSSNAEYVSNGMKYYSTDGGIDESVVYGSSRWDPTKFYNIYVVSKFYTSSLNGFAYYPQSSDSYFGTVMKAEVVNNTSQTLCHEFGHSLGLAHTFGSSSDTECATETDCTTEGDYVCDTEPHRKWEYKPPYYDCYTNDDINICTGVNYQSTQYNIMGYNHGCRDRFTAGQIERALSQFRLHRSDLMYSEMTLPPPASTLDTVILVDAECNTPNTGITDRDGPHFIGLGGLAFYSGGSVDDGYFYKDHTINGCRDYAVTGTLVKGTTDTLHFSLDIGNYVKAYIDFNNNGSFESSEVIYKSMSQLHSGSFSMAISIPEDAVLNTPLRFRMIADYYEIDGPCSSLVYGQAEDFAMIITSPLSIFVKDFKVNPELCGNKIQWNITDVNEIKSIDLEVSNNGIQFSTLESFSGNKLKSLNEYFAPIENSKIQYYRLNIIMNNGEKSLSRVVSVQNACEYNFTISPNPATDILTIAYNAFTNDMGAIHIVDVTGKIVYNQNLSINKGANEFKVNLNNLPAGSYFVKITSERISQQKLFIKK